MATRIILILILLVGCTENEEMRVFTQVFNSDNIVNVILITGQSNAVGFATTVGLPTQDLQPFENVKIWNDSIDGFEDLQIGVNNQTDPHADKHGVELELAKQYYDDFTAPLYIIKYGYGGTRIKQHFDYEPTVLTPWVYPTFYDDNVVKGINNLLAQGKRPFIWIYWCQGEADASPSYTPDYSTSLDYWTDMYKTIFGSTVPFIFCEIIEANASDIIINGTFATKSAEVGTEGAVIETSGLSDIGDGVHYDTTAFDTIGARAIINMLALAPIEVTSQL